MAITFGSSTGEKWPLVPLSLLAFLVSGMFSASDWHLFVMHNKSALGAELSTRKLRHIRGASASLLCGCDQHSHCAACLGDKHALSSRDVNHALWWMASAWTQSINTTSDCFSADRKLLLFRSELHSDDPCGSLPIQWFYDITTTGVIMFIVHLI